MQLKNILLASSQFPSGVAWLLNFFLEINLLIYRSEKLEDSWKFDEERQLYTLEKDEEVLKQWIPLFFEKTTFGFTDNVAIKWTHDFPNRGNSDKKIILLVRDGRDVIYSQFKREKIFKTFLEMLDGLSSPLRLPYPETWAIFNYLWLKTVQPKNTFIIKFEDLKTNPYPVIKELLKFIGITRAEEQIKYAVERSSFDRAKKTEEEYKKQNAKTQFETVNRGGKVGEWRQTYGEKELGYFKDFPGAVLKLFGYEIDGADAHLKSIEKNNSSSVLDLKEKLIVDIKTAGENLNLLLKSGRAALCLDWFNTLCARKKIDGGDKILLDALFEACSLMRRTEYMNIEMARAFGNMGMKKQARLLLDSADDSYLSKDQILEKGIVYALNYRFRDARKYIATAGRSDWVSIILKEKLRLDPNKSIFFSLSRKITSFLPMSVRRLLRQFLQKIKLIF